MSNLLKRKIGQFIRSHFSDVDFEYQGSSKKQKDDKIWSLKFEYFFNAFESYNFKRSIDCEIVKRLTTGSLQGIDSVYLVINNKFFAIPEHNDVDFLEYMTEIESRLKEDQLDVTFYFSQVKSSNPKLSDFVLFCDSVYSVFDSSNKTMAISDRINVLRETLKKVAKKTESISVVLKFFVAGFDQKKISEIEQTWKETIDKKSLEIKSYHFKAVKITLLSGQEYLSKLDNYNSPNKRDFEVSEIKKRFISLESEGTVTYFGHLTIRDVINLLSDDEGNLDDTNVFFDNIRYFQGDTTVNSKILKSLNTNGKVFHTLHNGIIITSSKSHYNVENGNLVLSGFSIVNGCQTCNMIWRWLESKQKNELSPNAKKKLNENLKLYNIPTKIVITPNYELRNKITEAANTQNPIRSINLVAISESAKVLEKKFNDLVLQDRQEKLIFRRLPKESLNGSSVLNVNLEDVARAFYSVFSRAPHEVSRSFYKYLEGKLNSEDFLSDKEDRQYDIGSYFVTSLVSNYLLRFLKSRYKRLVSLRNHFLLLFFMLIDPEERNFKPTSIEPDFVSSVVEIVDNKDEFEERCVYICDFAQDKLHYFIDSSGMNLSVKPKSYYSEENTKQMMQDFIRYRG